MNNPWYKKAVIYSLDVETFYDSDDDGTGDFQGLILKLEYLSDLGINCIWLLPFYPSPQRDNGYDVTDYYGIDPRLGKMGDFVEFIERATELKIKVIIDLVFNHTSYQHEWFTQARTDKNSKYKNYYIWSKEKPENSPWEVAFHGEQEHVWSYDDLAGEYYLHRFYPEQPDLNIANPEVKKEIKRIMEFWLKMGVSGFRIDAAHVLIDLEHLIDKKVQDYSILSFMSGITAKYGDILLLAEANDEPEQLKKYFGEGDRMNALFNFLLNQHFFLSLAKEDSGPVENICRVISLKPGHGIWLNFIRHHDELTLDKLSTEDRHFIFNKFAPQKYMQIYERGIRRRLAPMLNKNRKKIEMVYSFFLSLPGIPLIRYGDEIGMGDDLSLQGRESVRTVMQWNEEKNGGFSNAEPEKLIKTVITTGEYGFQKINARNQKQDEKSFLNRIKSFIYIRHEYDIIHQGQFEPVKTDNSKIFVHKIFRNNQTFIACHNFSGERVKLPSDIILPSTNVLASDDSHGHDIKELGPYGYIWIINEQ